MFVLLVQEVHMQALWDSQVVNPVQLDFFADLIHRCLFHATVDITHFLDQSIVKFVLLDSSVFLHC